MAIAGITERGTVILALGGFVIVLWIGFFVLLAMNKRVSATPDAETKFGYRLASGLVAFLPTTWLAIFGLFVLRARIRLGHWPHPGHIDPNDSNPFGWVPSPLDPKAMPLHHWVVGWLALAAALSLVLFPALHLLDRRVNGKRAFNATLLYLLTFVAMTLVWVIDPGDFLSWYLD